MAGRDELLGFDGVPARVVIAGGGVAGLEALLALRALAQDKVSVEVVSPAREFVYRALSVLEPFGEKTPRFQLGEIAADQGARHRTDAVAEVDPERKRLRLRDGDELAYDALVVATGTRPRDAIPGALTFAADVSGETFSVLLDELEQGRVDRVVFALPPGAIWSLPLYELALNTAARLESRGKSASLTIVTPENAPLDLFGREASDAVAELLDARGVEVLTGTRAVAVEGDELSLDPDGRIVADRVVALPRLEGVSLLGLPRDDDGFIPTQLDGRVEGAPDVYAVGDVTTFPVKQGGLAAEQADAVAELIAARAGARVRPRPFRPVLRGMLLSGGEDGPHYLSAEVTQGPVGRSEVDQEPLWWPPSKVFGRYLAPYLARHEMLSRPRRPRADVRTIAFEVALEQQLGRRGA